MNALLEANQIIDVPWCSSVLRQKAWDYAMAANRRKQLKENIASVMMVLADVPEYLRDSLKQATAEELAAKGLFLKVWQDERSVRGLPR